MDRGIVFVSGGFVLRYKFIYCKVYVYLSSLIFSIFFTPINKHEVVNLSSYMYVKNEFCLKHPRVALCQRHCLVLTDVSQSY